MVRWSTQHKTLMFRCQMNPLQASILSQTTITKVLCCYVMLFTSDESCLRVGDYVYTLRRLIFQLTNDGWRTSLPLLDPFKPFHSLIENGVQFLKLDSLSKAFALRELWEKWNALLFTFLMFISDHCQDCLMDEVRIQISLSWLFRKIIKIEIDSRVERWFKS